MGDSSTNLIINYLPQTLTDDEFRQMFLSIGPLQSCKIIRDRATGYSYGFGFVDYVNEQDAQRAISTLNGLQLQNKTLKVALARTGEGVKGANLYLKNIPRSYSEQEVHELFSKYGYVINCRVLKDTHTGLSKGVGFCLFEKREQADAAIADLNSKPLRGGTDPFSVAYADDNRGKARPPPMPPAPPAGRGGYHGSYPHPPPPPGPPHRSGYMNGNGAGFYGAGSGGYGGPQESSYGPGPMRNMGAGGRHRYNPTGPYNPPPPPPPAAAVAPGSGPNITGDGYVLFIYNIGADADEQTLWQLFAPFGAVQKVNVIRDAQKNQTKGYGFVTMTNYHEAMNAIQGLNGFRYEGNPQKPLQVSFKSPKA